MKPTPNVIWIELDKKLADKDRATFDRLLFSGPLTWRLDRIAEMLNRR